MKQIPTLPWRRMFYVVGSFLLAFASGHFVQSHVATASETPQLTTTAMDAVAVPGSVAPLEQVCARTFEVSPGIAGMVRVVLSDTCNAGTIVSVSQGQLTADWVLDAEGTRHVSFTPIDDAPLVVTWHDGAEESHPLPEAEGTDTFRFALAWSGPQYLSLAAQEFGARAGTDGHIHAAHTGEAARASRGVGGFLTVLGDGVGRTAEVYTFPADIRVTGVVRLSVSAPVTLRTCGRTARATALQSDPFGGLLTSQVDIALPECDAIGQTLVLRNLFRDLRLAAN